MGFGGWGRCCLRTQTCSLQMNKSWRSNAQSSDYTQYHCIRNFKADKRLGLNCSHHTKEMIIMWRGGNHMVTYKCIKSTLYTYTMSYVKYILMFKTPISDSLPSFIQNNMWIPDSLGIKEASHNKHVLKAVPAPQGDDSLIRCHEKVCFGVGGMLRHWEPRCGLSL